MRRRTKVIIAMVVIAGLLISGTWMYYTGTLARILFTLLMLSIPPTPKEPQGSTQWPPMPSNMTTEPPPEVPEIGVNETRIVVERIELIKVADKLMTLTDINVKPKIQFVNNVPQVTFIGTGWYVNSENVVIGYHDEKMAFAAYFPANKSATFSIDPKPDTQLRYVTGTLRLRVRIATSVPDYFVIVTPPIPRNPAGGASPVVFVVISSTYVDISGAQESGAFLGKNFFMYPKLTFEEWIACDFNYSDLWPGSERIIGWPLSVGRGISVDFHAHKISIGNPTPPSIPYFAAVGVDTTLYEPSALCKITIRNNFTEPIIKLKVKVNSDWVNIYLSKPLEPGETVSATVSFLEEFNLGETYNITVEATYIRWYEIEGVRIGAPAKIVKVVQVPCVSGS